MTGEQIGFIGCYTDENKKGIYRFSLSAQTGECRAELLDIPLENPSYLIYSKKMKHVYLVSETRTFQGNVGGAVADYICKGEELYLNSIQPTHGMDPCYLTLDKEETHLLVANYSSGSCTVLPLNSKGDLLPQSQLIAHQGRGKNEKRQEAPHIHCICKSPGGNEFGMCDLGLDRVSFYDFQEGKLLEETAQEVCLPEESGPRHLVWRADGKSVYVVNELANTVAFLQKDNRTWRLVQVISALPQSFKGESTCAAIKLSPDERFLYVSNRGHDSITCFSVEDSGLLRFVEIVDTRGKIPRDFTIDPTGNFILVANQEEGGVSVFRRNSDTGKIVYTGNRMELPKPVCICFL